MAKQRSQKPAAKVRRPVRLELPEEQHRELRVLAAAAGKPMSQFVRDIVLEAIAKRAKRK
jgi:hypothetical protein